MLTLTPDPVRPQTYMSRTHAFWRSSIGSKTLMAITGVLLFLFVVAHLVGNLQIFAGPEKLNGYAKMLADLGPLLWVARLSLLAIFVLHVATAIRLSRANKKARPVPYAREETIQATFASRSMLLSGLSLRAFVVYHLMHFTFGAVHGDDYVLKQGGGGHDVYAMVVASFSQAPIAFAYIAFQVLLFFHLSHGLQSFAQTIGVNHARYTPKIKSLSFLLAALVAGGNILLALAPMLGLVKAVA